MVLSGKLPGKIQALGLRKGLNVHGLRKLAAANLAEAGCSTLEIAAITGHASLGMVQLYTKSADQERMATAAIVRLTGRKK
jgi:integrase